MEKPAEATSASAIDIRFGQVGLLQVRLRTTDPGAILDELTGKIATAPQFFKHTAVCLDLAALDTEPGVSEIRGIIDAVRRAGMLAVGIADSAPFAAALGRSLALPVMSGFRAQSNPKPAARPVEAPPSGLPALLHTQPVRSGQRIYARDRDLIVTSTVGAGAEVMADGCVHIYGSLRGRAMAGVRGDAHARLFCQEFNAELVAVAGVFRVFETLPPALTGHPVQAFLADDELHFARIGA